MSENPYRLNVDEIQTFLPHRSPFLLIDRILEIHPTGDLNDTSSKNKTGTRVVAQKAVSFNEPYFQGHFPGFAILPGVLTIEIMAQASSFSLYPYLRNKTEERRGVRCILVGVDGTRFRRPVVPGDVLTVETVVKRTRGDLWIFDCKATVDGQLAVEAEIMANWISNT